MSLTIAPTPPDKSDILFKAKTEDGFCFRLLSELFALNIKECNLVVSNKGITMSSVDRQRKICFALDLDADSFQTYKLNLDEGESNFRIGIATRHFARVMKTCKKRDTVEFFILKSSREFLDINIYTKCKSKVASAQIRNQILQLKDIPMIEGYGRPVIIKSNEFLKVVKDLGSITKLISVTGTSRLIEFKSSVENVFFKTFYFGEEDSDELSEIAARPVYSDEFENSQFTSISKISSLSSSLSLYYANNLPIKFKTSVGSLGTLIVYCKSRSILAREQCE